MIDLTLDSLLIPDILGYTPPFGTKIATTAENKGGLSTQQVNDNILLPFAKQRAVVVEASDTTSKVEYDARIIVSGDGLTITVPSNSFAGCNLSVLSPSGTNQLNINSETHTLVPGQSYSFVFSGEKWLPDCPYPVGGVYTQYPQQEPPAKLWIGTTWEELDFSGAFFRATGGNAEAFIEKTDNLKKQQEGLPNVTGSLFLRGPEGAHIQKSGVFASSYSSGTHGYNHQTGGPSTTVVFDSSKANSIYGRSAHVTPENFSIRILRRVS